MSARTDLVTSIDIDALCKLSHEAYEQAAVKVGWETNPSSRVNWANVPEANKIAMRASVSAVAARVEQEVRQQIKADLMAEADQHDNPYSRAAFRRAAIIAEGGPDADG